ncbi:cell division suppressor protein YneA [Mesobacillus harenae]|uniref:cell division suppressor protein YneA n=1 Tax=Mesobacillus harenae TaxID=2213203 RepID=UPI00158064C2|nr:LysM peptidoglycan-binding domain-containing protein [Mesobacillus harenae]
MRKLWKNYSYAIILIGVSFISSFVLIGHADETHEDLLVVTVEEGESLWQISERFAGEHSLNHSEFINWVEKNNGISGDRIHPGEELVIPVKLSENTGTELASSE